MSNESEEVVYLGLKKLPDEFEVLNIQVTRDNLEKIVRGYEQYRATVEGKLHKIRANYGAKRTQLPKPVIISILSSETVSRDECIRRGLFIHPETRIKDNTIYCLPKDET